MRDFYVDESSQSQNHYLVIGGVSVDTHQAADLLAKLQPILDAHNMTRELKWGKVSRAKLPFYKELLETFVMETRNGGADFHAMIVDNHRINNARFNFGDADLGFSKFLYQFLLHKAGRLYGAKHQLYVYLDSRTTRQQPGDLKPMLNGALRKRGIAGSPFRRITFACSKKSLLVQVADLLCGCIQFHKNGGHKLAGSSPAKCELAGHVALLVYVDELGYNTDRGEQRFSMWNFRLSE